LDDSYDDCFTLEFLDKNKNAIHVKAYFSSLVNFENVKQGIICLAIKVEDLEVTDIALKKSKKNAKNNQLN